MSLSVALKTANSGLLAAQAGLRTVSDNIANVNTPGYVRKTVNQQPLAVAGQGMGVKIEGVKRITDQYLQLASLTAGSDASRWGVVSQYLDNAQSLFGDPSSDSFFFSRLDDVWSAFASAADDPSSSLVRTQAVFNMQDFLRDADRINGQIEDLGANLDTQIQADVGRANDLLGQIDKLNQDISRATLVGGDASGSQNIQSQLIDELSTLLNVKVMDRANGGVTIRSTEGVVLAGEGAATLTYNRTDGSKGYITAAPALGVAQAIQVNSGEIRGLLDLRDDKLPGLSSQLGEFVARAVDRINAAHNASASLPAPASMTGRNTGLDSATAASGFTGSSTVAIVNANGVMQRRVTVNFAASTISVDGAAATPFVGNPITALNTALGAFGAATFANGALTIAAAGGNGVAIDEGTSAKAGHGFSGFFGLNDVIRSTGFTNYDTGLKSTDAHGFTPGGLITFQMAQADGKPLAQVQVAMPAAANMSDLLNSLNSTSSGVGLYGQFNLDANGALAFTAAQPANASLSVISDATQRGVGGPGLSQLFGLSSIDRGSRASRYTLDAAISADPMKLSLGKLDITAGTTPALRPGDGGGALAMAGAGDTPTSFSAAGTMGAVTMTVSRYAQEFGGSIGREAAAADTRMTSAQSVQTEATARRQSVEGVNLDEELVMLTTYQQAFNASARMIQAAKDMFDVLTAMI